MTTAAATRGPIARDGAAEGGRGFGRLALTYLVVIVAILVVWEGVKFLGGVPWRAPGAVPGPNNPILWNPPFRWDFANDLRLPHVWNILIALGKPFESGTDESLAQYLFGAALYTWREAAIGFALGAVLGLVLATAFVHSRLLERAFVPYVIASQTIPIIALAPLIAFTVGQNVLAVVIIATYLTFFPVTIAMIRGLRSVDPRAIEMMRSYAASPAQVYFKVRLPASLPYLFTALKISATASVVGAIIGEDAGSVAAGLGRVITTFNQYYATGPEKLWTAIIAAALVGIAFFLVVRVAELLVLRGRPGAAAG
jgi:NitT/TauT family transport system permease protein